MTLILRTVVVLAILLASTNATPPPGYVKQPDNDENPPSYRYKYEVEDKRPGDGHGKTEAREGEHARGRYYVNSGRASTDVKYIADEWGYHPLVKYAAANDHSSASASFAFGEKAVNDLLNEKSGQFTSEVEQAKLLQPYPNVENETFEGAAQLSIESEPSANPLKVNYITGEPRLIEPVSAGNNELFFPNGHQSQTVQQQDNKLSSADDQLIVENAGSFGLRAAHAAEESYSTTTASPSSTRAGRYFHGRTRQKNVKLYLPDTIPGLSAYSSSAFPPVQDNSVGSEADQSADAPATTTSPLLINYGASQAVLSSKTAQELVATIEKSERHLASFAKPIVVQEVQNSDEQRPFQYSTTFECEDDEQPITANPLSQASDSASSHILNPIQAGVALVNAGEAHLIGESESPQPAPVNEHVEDDAPPQVVSQAQIVGNSIVAQQSAGNYVGVNPAFGGVHDEARASTTPQPQVPQSQVQRQDQSVEVQKSIEIYSSSPAGNQELQLTEQQQPSSSTTTIDQQQYLANLAEIGAKQGSTRTRSETFTKLYEISDNYPKDSAADKPVYVVPPATYVLEDSSVLRNSLLQEKIHRHELGQSETKKQRQPYRPFERKKIPISHAYPIPVVPLPIPIEKVIERKVPVPVHIPIPHPYPVEKPVPIPVPIEKIVEKPIHIPIPVEKIIEKKIPVSQPYPIEVTKYIEKPVIVHAPYGVHYGVSYQQIMKPQNHGLYNNNLALASSGLLNYVNKNEAIGSNSLNHSQVFQGYVYDKPAIAFHEGKENKLPYNSYIPPSYQSSGSNGLFHRRHAQPQRDDYFGPVPPLQHAQRLFGFQSKQPYASYPERPQLQAGSRKSRNHEPPPRFQKGNFRQSKIEYGFKPPMVPSVQYDEETASKIES